MPWTPVTLPVFNDAPAGSNCRTGAGGFHKSNWCWRGGGFANAPSGWNGWAAKGVPLPKLPSLGKADFKDHKEAPEKGGAPKRGMPEAAPNASGKPQAHFTVGKSLGGSTGANVATTETGGKYVVKQPGNATKAHLASEVAADNLYKVAGIDVPTSLIIPKGSDVGLPEGTKLANFVEGTPLGHLHGAEKAAAVKELQKGFVMDALLANWDVIGAAQDNVLVGKDGKVWRIDNGGSLDFRAQGKAKVFTEDVKELTSMRLSAQGHDVFGSLTDADIAAQIPGVLAKKGAILAATPEYLRGKMEKRLDYLEKFHEKHAAKAPVAPVVKKTKKPKAPKVEIPKKEYVPIKDIATMVESHSAYITDRRAAVASLGSKIKSYTGDGYRKLNERARACPPKFGCLNTHQKGTMNALTKLIDEAPPLANRPTLYRGIGDDSVATKLLAQFGKVGAEFNMPSLTSTSHDKRQADKFTHRLQLRIEKASRGLAVQNHSEHYGEYEVIVSPTGRYRVKEITKDSTSYGSKYDVIVLEEVQ